MSLIRLTLRKQWNIRMVIVFPEMSIKFFNESPEKWNGNKQFICEIDSVRVSSKLKINMNQWFSIVWKKSKITELRCWFFLLYVGIVSTSQEIFCPIIAPVLHTKPKHKHFHAIIFQKITVFLKLILLSLASSGRWEIYYFLYIYFF